MNGCFVRFVRDKRDRRFVVLVAHLLQYFVKRNIVRAEDRRDFGEHPRFIGCGYAQIIRAAVILGEFNALFGFFLVFERRIFIFRMR